MSFMVLTINITIDGSKWAPLGRLVWDFAGGPVVRTVHFHC